MAAETPRPQPGDTGRGLTPAHTTSPEQRTRTRRLWRLCSKSPQSGGLCPPVPGDGPSQRGHICSDALFSTQACALGASPSMEHWADGPRDRGRSGGGLWGQSNLSREAGASDTMTGGPDYRAGDRPTVPRPPTLGLSSEAAGAAEGPGTQGTCEQEGSHGERGGAQSTEDGQRTGDQARGAPRGQAWGGLRGKHRVKVTRRREQVRPQGSAPEQQVGPAPRCHRP